MDNYYGMTQSIHNQIRQGRVRYPQLNRDRLSRRAEDYQQTFNSFPCWGAYLKLLKKETEGVPKNASNFS